MVPTSDTPLVHPRTNRLAHHLEWSKGAFTRADIIARWTRRLLENALRDGAVVRILPGVYCAAAHAGHPQTLGAALNLWSPNGLVSGALALHLIAPALPAPTALQPAQRLGRVGPPPAVLVVPHGDKRRAPDWVRVVQAPQVAAVIAQGVRCVVPERAVLDAWVAAPCNTRADVVYGALWEQACTWNQFRHELRRAPRVRGRRELERLLGWFEAGATSPLEVRARRDVFAGPNWAALEWQAVVRAGSRKMRVDALHRAARVVIEFDGARYHSAPDAVAADRERDVELAAAGYVTVRLGWNDVVYRPRWCRGRVLAVIAQRGQHSVRT